MIAAVIENGVVVNRIVVDDLNAFPGLVDGEACNIGDLWDGEKFTAPSPPDSVSTP